MVVVKILLTAIHMVACVLLIIVILLQSSKGGGLSGTFGGTGTTAFFGPRGTADILTKVTRYLAAGFMILSLTLSLLASAGMERKSVTQEVLKEMPAANLPAIEDLEVPMEESGPPSGAGAAEGEGGFETIPEDGE